ncbi:MAG: PSD1 and planctomycete cytochrome C domain-containing protein [Verrucomicrobiales bacterium]|nr:PSD1 and planctomycete cytochrome C domain-containing protein [Verrucomicrobiales bacterium]
MNFLSSIVNNVMRTLLSAIPGRFADRSVRVTYFSTVYLVHFACLSAFSTEIGEVDFNRDIRPILSDKCFHCHGPDAKNQRSDFRIDTREHAMEDLDGVRGIVPGDLDESEVHWRIRLPNDDIDVMPPLDSNRVLSNREKDLLDAWIKQGADYDIHWSFKKPVKHDPPSLKSEELQKQVKNEIDSFIFAKLEDEGLKPQPVADLEIRLRRASLSLTGLLPDIKDVDAALAKPDPETAYHEFVDQLLGSIHYAERQTLRWLNAARFADTDGYQNDSPRTNWPWRDWVIQAYHENKPFDEFTIEQLAGDLLPDATKDQILATAFNRNHRQNAEGGALADEFFVENVIDRVETTSTVWLGLTMGCARCHDHKYDPLSQKEFFQMFAYFNNIGEKGIGKGVSANPVMEFSSPLVKPPAELVTELQQAKKQKAEAQKTFNKRRDAWVAEATASLQNKGGSWKRQSDIASAKVTKGDGGLIREDDGSLLFEGQNVRQATYEVNFAPAGKTVTAIRIDAMPHPTFSKPRKLSRSVNGNFVLTDVKLEIINSETGRARPAEIGSAVASFEQDRYPISNAIDTNPKTGWAVFGPGVMPETVSATFLPAKEIVIGEKESLRLRLDHNSNFTDHNIGRFRISVSSEPQPVNSSFNPKVLSALETPAKKRSARERNTLTNFYKTIDQPTKDADRALTVVERKLTAAGAAIVPVMVMQERDGDRIPAYLLDRGQYDAPDRSEELTRGIPVAFFDGEEEDQPQDRLELARWIVSRENPLTARVIVNRIWQDHFGIGLVKTSEDFGAQSQLPSHPELLDWLAVDFIESGWDVKALHRKIVTSAAFVQGTVVDRTLYDRDPENHLLARGPRFRLDGFSIRDIALQVSGLLDNRVGGPPVKPYQPEGLWNNLGSNANTRYNVSKGNDLYRKSLYTFWKRAVNPPRQLIFDAGGREACDVSVRRTNTPLQALVLMNDETFLEAARNLVEWGLKEVEGKDQRLGEIYRKATALKVDENQLAVLRGNLDYFTKYFGENPDKAEEFLKAGMSQRDEAIPIADHAAWTAVAHLILNLDTTITLQ